MPFKADNERGTFAEKLVCQCLAYAGCSPGLNDDKRRLGDFDILADFNGRAFSLEVKYDLYEVRSGNVAFEFFNPRLSKESGLGITKADLWVHVLQGPTTAWVTRVSDLKKYIATHKPLRTVACGGDNNSSMYLYNRETIFAAIFHRIDRLTRDEMRRLIADLVDPASNNPAIALPRAA